MNGQTARSSFIDQYQKFVSSNHGNSRNPSLAANDDAASRGREWMEKILLLQRAIDETTNREAQVLRTEDGGASTRDLGGNANRSFRSESDNAVDADASAETARTGLTDEENGHFLSDAANSAASREREWMEMFGELTDYKAQYGDTVVPVNYDQNPALSRWVHLQRNKYKKNELSWGRVRLLNGIDFVWDASKYSCRYDHGRWMDMFQKLVEYQKNNEFTKAGGHACTMADMDSKLSAWVKTQRRVYKKNEMLEERVALLDSIGFTWDAVDHVNPRESERWTAMFVQLNQYQQKYGTTNVPVRNDEYVKLADWVLHQRYHFKNNTMTQDRIDLLNSINFEWETE